MDFYEGYSSVLFLVLCFVLVEPCSAYGYTYSTKYWWGSLAIFLLALSCCGAAFCYDRLKDFDLLPAVMRRRRRRHRHGRPQIARLPHNTRYPQVVRTGSIAAFNSYSNLVSLMLMTPSEPGVYLPPSYDDSSNTIAAFQPGGKQSEGMSRPPSYSKIYEASAGPV